MLAPTSRRRELLWACLALAGLVLLYFSLVLAAGGLTDADMGVFVDPARRSFQNGGERFFLFLPWFKFEAASLARGELPIWTPFAACGTPFIGKQQPGLFYPLHALFYLLPSPYTWTAMFALRHFLAGLFAFLLARSLSLKFWGALLAAVLYMFSDQPANFGMEAQFAADILVPALMLVTEQHFSGDRRRSLLLLPLVVGLLALSGHSETALRAYVMAGAYFSVRLWQTGQGSARVFLQGLAAYAGCAAAGALVAAAQLIPAQEYYSRGYGAVWRAGADSVFYLRNMAKSLSAGDAPPLACALAAAILSALAFSRVGPASSSSPRRALGWGLFAAGCLAVAVACWSNVGLWPDPLEILGCSWKEVDFGHFINIAAGTAVYCLALLALCRRETPGPVRLYGWIFLAGLLCYLQTPPLVQVLNLIPLWNMTYFAHSNNFAIELCLAAAVLAGAGWDRLLALYDGPASERRRAAALAAGLYLAAWAGLCAGLWAAPQAADWLGSGINPANWSQSQSEDAGGIMDAGELIVSAGPATRVVRGWLPQDPAPLGVTVGFATPDGKRAQWGAPELSRRGQRVYFRGEARLPVAQGVLEPVAVVQYAQGKRVLRGSRLTLRPARPWARWDAAAAGLFLALGLGLACLAGGPRWLVAGAVPLVLAEVLILGWGRLSLLPRSNYLPQIPAVHAMQKDQDLYRIFSHDPNVLPPEGSGLYGLQDFRNFDAVGPLGHSHFSRLAYHALFTAGPSQRALGARLLGLANVKYVLEFPGLALDPKLFTPVYRGELDVFRNTMARPRAQFFSSARLVPGDASRWDKGLALIEELYAGLSSGKLDPERTLVLHDAPPAMPPDRAPDIKEQGARILSYEDSRVRVESASPGPGFVFLADTAFPGWSATVDGRPAPILRAWVNFRAVAVPAGRHLVEFAYRPSSLKLALAVSVAAMFLLLLLGSRCGPGLPGEAAAWFDCGDTAVLALAWCGALYWFGWAAFWSCGGPALRVFFGLLFAALAWRGLGLLRPWPAAPARPKP